MKKSCATDTLESMGQAIWYNRWTLQKFEQYLKGDILEVGCGVGNFTNTLANYGKVWAIDSNNEYIKKTREGVEGSARVGSGDIEKGEYFFNNQKFETIVCLNVLEHIKDDEAALQNMYNLLNKGGKLTLLVPVYNFLYGEIDRSINHFRRYDPGQLKKQLEQIGFTIEKSRKLNFLGALGWFIAGRIFGENKIKKGNIKIFNLIAPFILSLENLVEPPIGTSILIIVQKND